MTEHKGDVGTPAKETPNEWGVPDWKCAKSYGNTDEWSMNRWRWEFIRRRRDVRKAFDETADQTYLEAVDLIQSGPEFLREREALKPDEPGFGSNHQIAKELGLPNLPNPRIGNQPFYAISFNDWPEGLTQFYSKEPPEGYRRVDFDLNKPLEPQLKFAKQVLQDSQIKLLGKKLQSRRHRKKWLLYLRTLDARASNASWSEISILHENTARTEQTARDVWKAANELRFNF